MKKIIILSIIVCSILFFVPEKCTKRYSYLFVQKLYHHLFSLVIRTQRFHVRYLLPMQEELFQKIHTLIPKKLS